MPRIAKNTPKDLDAHDVKMDSKNKIIIVYLSDNIELYSFEF